MFQSEQIPMPQWMAHGIDYYKRPGKPVWSHGEFYAETGTGEQLGTFLFQQIMRGAEGVGWNGKQPGKAGPQLHIGIGRGIAIAIAASRPGVARAETRCQCCSSTGMVTRHGWGSAEGKVDGAGGVAGCPGAVFPTATGGELPRERLGDLLMPYCRAGAAIGIPFEQSTGRRAISGPDDTAVLPATGAGRQDDCRHLL
jgi:hypothetical protein